jgi:hypothetical protein
VRTERLPSPVWKSRSYADLARFAIHGEGLRSLPIAFSARSRPSRLPFPENASWDDLMYEVYVRQAVERGIADADAGRVVSHDEAMARLGLKK